jgi:pimeloyl-ACP methyl ester carboxylesterase
VGGPGHAGSGSLPLLVEIYHEPKRFFDRLERVDAPALLIAGRHDRLVRTGAAEDVARRKPGWTHQVLDGIGHVPMMEDPDRFVDVMWRWLDAVDTAVSGGSTSNVIT